MTRKATKPWGFSGWRWELLTDVRGQTLEIGCGWGSNFAHYPPEAHVTAFDIEWERVLHAARLRQPQVRVSAADAQQLGFSANTFEAVVGTLVFCSIPNPSQALAEIRRVLAPGGKLYLIDHVRSHQPWLASAQDALAPAWLAVTGGCNLNRRTEDVVRQSGFELLTVKVGWGDLLKLMIAR